MNHAGVGGATDFFNSLLSGRERVLDLCCGNGLITKKVAPHCRNLIGIDFSAALIETAKTCALTEGVEYFLGDVTKLPIEKLPGDAFDCAYMCFAAQHFSDIAFLDVLTGLRTVAKPAFRFYVDDIPDEARLGSYYDTEERRAEFFTRVANGDEAIGHWWPRSAFFEVVQRAGYRCRVVEMTEQRVNAHYRFSALVSTGDDLG